MFDTFDSIIKAVPIIKVGILKLTIKCVRKNKIQMFRTGNSFVRKRRNKSMNQNYNPKNSHLSAIVSQQLIGDIEFITLLKH